MRASRIGEASHPGPRSDTRRSFQRQRSRSRGVPEDVFDSLQFDLTQDDSDSNVQVNRRRRSPLHLQQVLRGRQAAGGQSQLSTVPACSNEDRVSHARVFGRPATLPTGSEVATEQDPVDPTSMDGTVNRPTLTDRSETQPVEPPTTEETIGVVVPRAKACTESTRRERVGHGESPQ